MPDVVVDSGEGSLAELSIVPESNDLPARFSTALARPLIYPTQVGI